VKNYGVNLEKEQWKKNSTSDKVEPQSAKKVGEML
jgi:hypothetical protein